MSNTYKLLARTINVEEISSFKLEDGETLNERVTKELDAAITAGKLNKMATRVGLPALAVTEIAEGESLSGGENSVSVALYAPDGSPLADRAWRVEQAGEESFVAIGVETDIETEITIGVFGDRATAEQVALFWANGHLKIGQ